MTTATTRRSFLASLAAAGALLARRTSAAAPPKETGLSHEGLLAGKPGFQPRAPMPLPYEELPGFLSRAQLAEHHRAYTSAFARLRQAEDGLRREDIDDRTYADLRRTQVAAGNAVLLHELYLGGLTAHPAPPARYIEHHMTEHMGSFDQWRTDFTRCALAGRAWAVLVYDPYDDRWHDVVMDADDRGAWIGANPLVVCDVAEHAIAENTSREEHVRRFLAHVDWEEVSRRYRAVDRM
ncbi:MAG TPA: Fe-Mn family superoxide dismutase [Candidatus Binatia bacterium]|jgi:Fe-Mn family superoxide dismutase